MDINHCQTHRATHQPLCHRPLMPPIHLWVHQQCRQLPFPHRERWAFPIPVTPFDTSRGSSLFTLMLWMFPVIFIYTFRIPPTARTVPHATVMAGPAFSRQYPTRWAPRETCAVALVAREPILVKLLPRLNDFKAALLPALKPSRPAIVAAAPALTVFDPWYATLAVLSTVLLIIAVSLPFDNVRCLYN